MSSWAPFEIIAALRFMREGFVQTLLIIIGVGVGVGVIVFMSALLTGLQNNITNRVLSTQPHIQVLPHKEVNAPVMTDGQAAIIRVMQSRTQRSQTIDQWQKLRDSLQALPVVDVVSPSASGSVLIARGAYKRSLSLTGIVPEHYYRIVDIPGDIVQGSARITTNDILIGKDLADDIGVHVGDKLHISSGTGAATNLNVAGIFDMGNKGFNSRTAIAMLSTAQGLLGMVGGVAAIDVTLRDPYAANEVADAFADLHNVEVDSWIRTNAQFFTAIHAQTISSAVIRVSVALSVALGIASVLAVSVVQRSKEIGILRAMGASQGQIMRVFLAQGGIVALLGSFIGSAIARATLAAWLLLARNPDGTAFFVLDIPLWLYAITALVAALTGVLAAVAPARRASQLDPVVAIRG